MIRYLVSTVATAALLASAVCHAQVPSGAPVGATGLCKDGTYYSGASKSGACSGHKGVKSWYGAASAPAVASAAPLAAAPAKATSSVAVAGTPVAAASVPAKPVGSAGQVWVNTATRVYHCPADKYYGKTKQGAYMTEADAKAKGFHGAQGKACQ